MSLRTLAMRESGATAVNNMINSIGTLSKDLAEQGKSVSANTQAIAALGTICTKLEGDIETLKPKVTKLEADDALQNQTNSQFRQRLDRSDARVISLEDRAVQENASNQLLANRVATLENSDRQHHQTQVSLNEARAKIAQLELQKQAQAETIEAGKRAQEKLGKNVSDLTATVQQLQQVFDAFQDAVKAKQKEDSILIEQLKEKVSEQATTSVLLSSDVKKAHRLSGEVLSENEPSTRAEKFKVRRERSLQHLPLPAKGKKLSSKPVKSDS